MDEYLVRALFLAAGLIIGLVLSTVYTNNRHVKRIIDRIEETQQMIEDWCQDHDECAPGLGKGPIPPGRKPGMGWKPPTRDQRGVIQMTFANFGIVLCIVIVVASLISTLNTNAKLADTQQAVVDAQSALTEQQRISDAQIACTTTTLFDVVDAANGRTAFTVEAADANIALQQAQLDFLRIVLSDRPEREGQVALGTYVRALTDFIQATTSTRNAAVNNPYPTKAGYIQCLQDARTPPTTQKAPKVLGSGRGPKESSRD